MTEQKAAAISHAEALRAALEGVREAPDPRADEEESTIAIVDGKALDAALGELDAYLAAVDAVEVPALPEPYQRADVDTDSLSSVGKAIDAAQQQLDELDAVGAELRSDKEQLDELASTFDAKRAAYAATFAKAAAQAVERNPDADDEVRAAMTDAGAAVVASKLHGADAAKVLTAYRSAYLALIVDQARVEQLRAEEEERRRQEEERRRRNPPPSQPESTPTPGPDETEPPSDTSSEMSSKTSSPVTGDDEG
ncbi:hypothetical protein L2X99_10555 [Microbacterium sp. KUDC0406]|uniref:hypothetical protein n=1 Tax=Microbacterium sp. KUDC0406 TaxID=2909588 RepID=UPI001F2A200A|nr:hypothetical protein [Microbacterium sp. KUDC0406]UJP08922.1 hypothetical protein L2X99_10555 [Microbacterium sp. KUDC0406]